jgi:hypothetical protein
MAFWSHFHVLIHGFRSAAGRILVAGNLIGSLFIGLNHTTTGTIGPTQHSINHSRSASDARLNRYGPKGTVPTAGPTFHTGIPIMDKNALAVHFQHIVRTDIQAHATSHAFISIKFQCHNIFEIYKMVHKQPLSNQA